LSEKFLGERRGFVADAVVAHQQPAGQRCSVSEDENMQLKELSRRITNEHDPEMLIALARELDPS